MNIQVEKNNLTHDKIFCRDSFTFRQNKKWVKKPTVVNGKKYIGITGQQRYWDGCINGVCA